jgi:hypothetical protein
MHISISQHFTTLQEIDILAHSYTLHCLCLSWACICWLDEHIHVLRCFRYLHKGHVRSLLSLDVGEMCSIVTEITHLVSQ